MCCRVACQRPALGGQRPPRCGWPAPPAWRAGRVHRLSDARRGRPRRPPRVPGREDPGRRLGVHPADEFGQAPGVEVMHRRAGWRVGRHGPARSRSDADPTTPPRPAGRQHGQVQPAQHAAEAHFDTTDQPEVPVGVGSAPRRRRRASRWPTTSTIWSVPARPARRFSLVGPAPGEVVDHIAVGAGGADAQHQLVLPDVHRFPWKQQQIKRRAPLHHHLVHQVRARVLHQVGGEVDQPADDAAVRAQHACPVTRLRNSTHEACCRILCPGAGRTRCNRRMRHCGW